MIRVVIVEDEPLAAQFLRAVLVETGNIAVVGFARNSHAGIQTCAEYVPDAVFLDIHLPGPDGMTLAKELARLPQPPLIVFTTGYANRACEAFRVDAIDYLVKPLDPALVRQSVSRLQERLSQGKPAASEQCAPQEAGPGRMRDRLTVKTRTDDVTLLLPHWEIVAALRHDRRTWIHTAREEYETYYPLTELMHVLPDPSFIRVGRESIINLQAVEEVIHYGDRLYQVRLRDRSKTHVVVSRSSTARLCALLKPSV